MALGNYSPLKRFLYLMSGTRALHRLSGRELMTSFLIQNRGQGDP